MKVLVPVKRVIDYNVKARVKADQSGVDLANVKMSMNPFDEIAVEEAVRLKEGKEHHAAGTATEIVVVSIGVTQAQETIRTALAMGADRGLLIQSDTDLEPLAVAKLLKAVVEEEKPDLILMGKQSIDGDNNAVGQMLAALLDWPQATFAGKLVIDAGKATVTREVDGGQEEGDRRQGGRRLRRRCRRPSEGPEGHRAAQAVGRRQGRRCGRTGFQTQVCGSAVIWLSSSSPITTVRPFATPPTRP
jgi:electron transfer flavoprotein alpha/beta subunit